MKVAFRADGGGNGLGIGHLMRCVALANMLSKHGAKSFFISKDYPSGIRLLEERGYQVATIPWQASLQEDLQRTLEFTQEADWIVADSYEFTTEYLAVLQANGKRVAFIDDLMDRELPVDVVIGNAYASKKNYDSKVDPYTQILAGPQYLPLREEFQQVPPHRIKEQMKHVLVTFGGEDANNVTRQVIDALSKYPRSLNLEILLGPAYSHPLEEMLVGLPHNYQIYHNLQNILSLLQKVDLAISSASTTVWELAAAGVPMVLLQTANNQNDTIHYVQDSKLGYAIKDLGELCQALNMFEDHALRQKYSHDCQSVVDGKGAQRIVESLMSMLILRPADADPTRQDSKHIWEWRNDSVTRMMSRHTESVTWEEHQNWYLHTMQNSQKRLLLAWYKDAPVGMVRFDFIDKDSAEININLNPAMRGGGLGKALLEGGCSYGFGCLHLKRIYAEIKPENVASIKIFESAGFRFLGLRNGMRTYEID